MKYEHDFLITIRAHTPRGFKWRFKLAVWLCWLAAKIGKCSVTIKVDR